VFYANGLHWAVFYGFPGSVYPRSPEGIYYCTKSQRGEQWSTPTYLTWSDYPDFFSLYYDGTFLHYAYAGYSGGKYAKCIPNNDGTITLVAPEQTIPEMGMGTYYDDPIICVDSFGYPWIGTYSDTEQQWPTIIKSDRNDGVWHTALGFPYRLTQASSHRGAGPVSLTNGKIYALYYRAFKSIQAPIPTLPILGKLWDGTWGAEEQASISHVENQEFHQLSYLSVGDDVHIVFHAKDALQLVYCRRTLKGWDSEVALQSVSSHRCSPELAYSPREGKLILFWIDNNKVYYKKGIGSDWSATLEWVAEVPIGEYFFVPPYTLTCSYVEVDGVIDMLWTMINKLEWVQGAKSLLRHNYLLYGH